MIFYIILFFHFNINSINHIYVTMEINLSNIIICSVIYLGYLFEKIDNRKF